MKFNTVVLYDIENLIKGYGFNQKMIQGVSLKEIIKEIKQTNLIGNIAIQRAYANWSDPRLGFFKQELLELGIEPIQVFGFSAYGSIKNAVDIQLAIDAIDLVHTRAFLETFVIVSGDGGFGSLAKKLHEYGKIVVGCAYKSSANKIFRAVSDAFIWIDEPEYEVKEELKTTSPILPPPALATNNTITDPRAIKVLKRIEAIDAEKHTQESILTKLKATFKVVEEDSDWQQDLKHGISPSSLKEIIRAVIFNFDPLKFGFSKFVEFLRFALKGTEICVYQVPPSDVKLGLRKFPLRNYIILEDLEQRDIHSIECYKSIMMTGAPIYRLPTMGELALIALALANEPLVNETLESAIARIANTSTIEVRQESVKYTLLAFSAAQTFHRDPETGSPMEQRLTQKNDFLTQEAIITNLFNQIYLKIKNVIGEDPDMEMIKDTLYYVA